MERENEPSTGRFSKEPIFASSMRSRLTEKSFGFKLYGHILEVNGPFMIHPYSFIEDVVYSEFKMTVCFQYQK